MNEGKLKEEKKKTIVEQKLYSQWNRKKKKIKYTIDPRRGDHGSRPPVFRFRLPQSWAKGKNRKKNNKSSTNRQAGAPREAIFAGTTKKISILRKPRASVATINITNEQTRNCNDSVAGSIATRFVVDDFRDRRNRELSSTFHVTVICNRSIREASALGRQEINFGILR